MHDHINLSAHLAITVIAPNAAAIISPFRSIQATKLPAVTDVLAV
jgi:hypothetical protein